MRISSVLLLTGIALWLGAGCAEQNQTLTAKPTAEELPQIPELGSGATQVTVEVEGRGHQPRVELVPSFAEPELTPEERAALGQEELIYSPLLYEYAIRTPGSIVASWYGGIEAYTSGHGGSDTFVGPPAPFAIYDERWGGISVGVDESVSPRGIPYYQMPGSAVVGGSDAGVSVGIDHASKVATHERHGEH